MVLTKAAITELPNYTDFKYQEKTVIIKHQGFRTKEWNRQKTRRKTVNKSKRRNRSK